MTIDQIRDRVASVCASQPFGFLQAVTPFSFDLQPAGEIDQVFRIESEGAGVVGGFSFTEDRTDFVQIWLARKYEGDANAMYRRLQTDASSIRAAVIRDGAIDSGEYCVVDDGSGMSLQREPARAYAVLRVTLPVNYEAFV